MKPSFVAVTFYVTGCILMETSVSYISGNNDEPRVGYRMPKGETQEQKKL